MEAVAVFGLERGERGEERDGEEEEGGGGKRGGDRGRVGADMAKTWGRKGVGVGANRRQTTPNERPSRN